MEEKFLSSARNCRALLSTVTIGISVMGVTRLSGQMFLACMERYNVGRKAASVPFTLTHIFRSVTGPITGYLGQKYGAKRVTDVGLFLSVISVGGCFFAEDITTVSILWGGIYGLASGFSSLLLPHILHDYFDKNYDKAHGIYMTGSCIGAFVLPLLTDKLLIYYGTSGTFLILSAVMMNSFMSSLVLEFLKPGIQFSKSSPACEVYTVEMNSEITCNNREEPNVLKSAIPERLQHQNKTNSSMSDSSSRESRPSTIGIPNSSGETNASCLKNGWEQRAEDSAKPKPASDTNSWKGVLDILCLFKDLPFEIIHITQCLFILIFLIVTTIIVDYARDVGVPSDLEVYVLVNVAVSDIFGRMFSGYIIDTGCISKVNFYAFSFVLVGVLLLIMTVARGFLILMILLLALGFVFGGIAMISSGIIIAFMNKEDLIIAMPCRYFLYPLFGLTKPFLIEFFREKQGSYRGLLFFLTGLSILCAIMCLLLPAAKRFREKRQAKS